MNNFPPFIAMRLSILASLRVALLALLVVLSTSCENSSSLTVVLVDGSASFAIAESSAARASLEAVLRGLTPGDRLVLGRISGQSVANYRFDFDTTLSSTGVSLDDRDSRDSVLARIRMTFDAILSTANAGQSNILDAMSAAEGVFVRASDHRNRRLVVIADMVHEAADYNFRTQPVDSALTARVLRERRAAGSIPNFAEVNVFVANAGGRTDRPESYFALHRFWMTYLAATGATIDSATYGRAALNAIRQ